MSNNKIKIFVASSNDLKEEREKFELLIRREDYESSFWENFDQSMTAESFQERINKEELTTSDIIIFLVKSKLGKFTLDEFDKAYENLGKSIKKIYVYFFETAWDIENENELKKIGELEKFLKEKEKSYIKIKTYQDLEIHFLQQVKHINNILKDEEPVVKKLGCCEYDIVKVAGKVLEELYRFIEKNSCEFCDEVKYTKVQKKLVKRFGRDIVKVSIKYLKKEKYIEFSMKDGFDRKSKDEYISMTLEGENMVRRWS